jgi:hypothetical protein
LFFYAWDYKENYFFGTRCKQIKAGNGTANDIFNNLIGEAKDLFFIE